MLKTLLVPCPWRPLTKESEDGVVGGGGGGWLEKKLPCAMNTLQYKLTKRVTELDRNWDRRRQTSGTDSSPRLCRIQWDWLIDKHGQGTDTETEDTDGLTGNRQTEDTDGLTGNRQTEDTDDLTGNRHRQETDRKQTETYTHYNSKKLQKIKDVSKKEKSKTDSWLL